MKADNPNSLLPALADLYQSSRARVDDFITAHFGKLHHRTSRRHGGGYVTGYNAGNKVACIARSVANERKRVSPMDNIEQHRASWRTLGAGIALGWYLMLPPGTANRPNSTAPLSQWDISASFDTADACEKMRLARAGRYFAPSLGLKKNPHPTEQDFFAHCIATDDPRLAK